MLDILSERGIQATFFVCAQGNRLHPALKASSDDGRRILERARREGHWVGNHSLTHSVELAPADCVPIKDGVVVGTLDGLVCGDEPESPAKLSKIAATMLD